MCVRSMCACLNVLKSVHKKMYTCALFREADTDKQKVTTDISKQTGLYSYVSVPYNISSFPVPLHRQFEICPFDFSFKHRGDTPATSPDIATSTAERPLAAHMPAELCRLWQRREERRWNRKRCWNRDTGLRECL